jgi:hypothetical protein
MIKMAETETIPAKETSIRFQIINKETKIFYSTKITPATFKVITSVEKQQKIMVLMMMISKMIFKKIQKSQELTLWKTWRMIINIIKLLMHMKVQVLMTISKTNSMLWIDKQSTIKSNNKKDEE